MQGEIFLVLLTLALNESAQTMKKFKTLIKKTHAGPVSNMLISTRGVWLHDIIKTKYYTQKIQVTTKHYIVVQANE